MRYLIFGKIKEKEMDAGTVKISMTDVMDTLDVKIKISGVKLFRFRCKLAILIMRLGGRIGGFAVELDVKDKTGCPTN